MPRFFLHLRDSTGSLDDPDGVECADLDAARLEAVHGARSIIADDALSGAIDLSGRIEIANEAGEFLLAVAFSDVVTVCGL